jgi:TonB-dependent receptor
MTGLIAAAGSFMRARARRHGYSTSLLALSAALSAGAAQAQNAPPSDASKLSEVVVTAKRAGSVQAALVEKQAAVAVTSIMSAEEISQRPGATIVDVLAHLPGISTFSDMGLGQASTGQAEYITIRGIDSSYNAYTLNGVRAPQADPSSRALSLKMVPPYGIESVAVVKTPTADMDGDAIGGIVDIRTPNAFDFSGPMLRVSANGNFSGFASELGAAAGGGGVQAEAARRFGSSDQFGVYVGAYYDRSKSVGEAVEVLGYVPTLRAQEPANLRDSVISSAAVQTDLAAATAGLSATGVRFDYYSNDITRFGGNIALDWRNNDNRLYLISSYAAYQNQSYDTQHQFIGAGLTVYGPTGTSPTYDPTGTIPGSYWQSRNQDEHLATFKLGGENKLDRLTLSYNASVGYSDIQEPNYVTASMYGVDTGNVFDGFTVNASNPAHVTFQFSSPALETLGPNNETTDKLWKYQGNNEGSSNLMYGGHMDAHYRIEKGVLDFVQAGFNIQIADRTQFDHPFFTDGPFGFGGGGQNFTILGPAGQIPSTSFFPFGPTVKSLPGYNISFLNGNYPGPFKVFNPAYLTSQIVPLAYTSQFAAGGLGNPGAYTQNDYNNQTVKGEEDVYAAYAEANFKYQDWAAVVGLRYEDTAFDFSQWADQTATSGHFVSTARSYGEVLPSLLVTWRPDSSMVFRGDIRESFARPAFGLFAAPVSVVTDPLTNQIIGASEGNPNLKPATAINYDLAAEFYGRNGDVIEVSAYYKQIHNFIFPATVSGGLPATGSTPQTIDGILLSMPENGKDASLEGLEFDVRHKLVGLPGPLDGLGLGGSLT